MEKRKNKNKMEINLNAAYAAIVVPILAGIYVGYVEHLGHFSKYYFIIHVLPFMTSLCFTIGWGFYNQYLRDIDVKRLEEKLETLEKIVDG